MFKASGIVMRYRQQDIEIFFWWNPHILLVSCRCNRKVPLSFQHAEYCQGCEEESMEKFLYDYIYRMTPFFGRIDEETAHEIASAVLSFKFGLYEKTVIDTSKALARLPSDDPGRVLKRALLILQERAIALEDAQVSDFAEGGFEPSDTQYLAVNLEPGLIEDQDSLNLDNALLLLYAVAYLQSPDDGQSLEEHQNFVIQILENYRESLNLK